MANSFLLKAEPRSDIGKGASRRLRREEKIPAVIYGGDGEAQSITISHFEILKHLNSDSFYSQIIDIDVNGDVTETVLRDLQRHPYKPTVLHADFQRVVRGQEITVNVPLHFLNTESAAGVKAGGIMSQHVINVEIRCRPRLLPEAIEVDVANLGMNEALHLSDLTLPEGVALTAFAEGDAEQADTAVVSIHPPKTSSNEEDTAEVEAESENE
ncbi:50S ribosomal protein L25/general stress protein Ctc [Ostreibacterium oceani]|uniref:Large ribosomal subunit protein bL25 n=1 Tax=Ostreibacterium oceani TaxID=2654998 RepID=A0A6N7EYJ1_9GAMM|nr:50S ribosomal protein L25/general stress protein Ctc [Ostreibacterium oceani]MPV85548.1 50S ribosomal protein L25/general stress protein Ctc [Ostreibacterium oceani]